MNIILLIGRKSINDNPNKAIILIKTGLHTGIAKGILKDTTKRGVNYKYNNKVIFVPSSYQELFCANKRILFVSGMGQLIASPFGKDVELADTEKEDLIYELIESHIGADGMRALRGKQSMSIIMVALIAFAIGAIGVYGVIQFQNTIAQKQPAPVTQTQTQQPKQVMPPKSIEVK